MVLMVLTAGCAGPPPGAGTDDTGDALQCPAGSLDPEGPDGDGVVDKPDWVPDSDGTVSDSEGPWTDALWVACSEDGLAWTFGGQVIRRADVPNLIRTADGKLVATFQYFSFTDDDAFNQIAWAWSDDDGLSWTTAELVRIDGLPSGQGGLVPVDPALVELPEGGFRLYFSWRAAGDEWVGLHSAVSPGLGDDFTYEEGLRLDIDAVLRDPGIAWFDGQWHHFAQVNVQGSTPRENYHSTSADGLVFTRQDDIVVDMMMLGNPVEMDGGLRFYASNRADTISAWSPDGFAWTLDAGVRVEGTWDVAVAPLSDGRWMMLYPAPIVDP